MIEYELEPEDNIINGGKKNTLFKSFKDKVFLRNKLFSQYYNFKDKLDNKFLFSKFTAVFGIVVSLFYSQCNNIGASILLSIPVSGFFTGILYLISINISKTKLGSKISNWYYGKFKNYKQIEKNYLNADIHLLELVQNPLIQKKLLTDLENLKSLMKPYYHENHFVYYNLGEEIKTLTGLLANQKYESVKNYISCRLETWEGILHSITQKQREHKKNNDFLKSINMETANNINQQKEYNLKDML